MRLAAALFALGLSLDALACGEVVTVQTHGGSTTRYALTVPQGAKGTLVLLPGGGGHADLDARGCAQNLKGNSLIRSQALFHREGLATALVDAPSDYTGAEGLGGFRASPAHAEDLAKVIADVRQRVPGPVWLVGTSRGAISASNAAGRLKGTAAPDGVVLTSPVTVGRLAWTAQTALDAPLEGVTVPLLLVGHAADACLRSPPDGMAAIAKRTKSQRLQVVTVTGGPGSRQSGLAACEGRSPHAFVEQEAEVAAGIARFVRGASY
jgi:hypothetical protein